MGRKGFKAKLLMFLMAASAAITGISGSVPLSAKAAEEGEAYTVTFMPYEGTCDTEKISVPRGESIILPDGSYEGHYLESWVDITDTVTEEGTTVTKFTAVGRPGSTYTPERSLWLYANWKPVEGQEGTVIYEAKIGDTGYEELEEAFVNARAGDTITVLRDCAVSGTLEVTADSITLKSEDAGNPVTVSRDENFAGKSYGNKTDTVLLAVEGGSLATQDIIFDGGAVLDGDFNNSGRTWNSPLIYVDGSYAMESGTVLQNNYNTDGYESEGSGRPLHTAGAVHVKEGGSLAMDNALIQNCYTSGGGGGIQSERDSQMAAASGIIKNCHATWGGGVELRGSAELSGMAFSGNSAGSSGGGISSSAPLTVTDCVIEGNSSAYDGGGICTGTGHQAHITDCTITGNKAPRGSAIQTFKGEGELPLVIRNCTITGNRSGEKIHAGGTICYMNETGIILSGKIVMEDNLAAGYEPCDIHYFYNTGASILLDEDFESDSTFVLGGYDVIKPGRVLIDGTLYHKEAGPEQFPWHSSAYCTEKRGENLYLAEVPKTYAVRYNANNNPAGTSLVCSDPVRYGSEDTAVIMDQEKLLPIMGHLVNPGYGFAGWNTEPDGTGTDYAPGQEVSLTDDLYLYAKWEAVGHVTLTYIYNDGEGRTDSAKVIPGAHIAFPDASRKGYCFKGWYEDEALTVFAGNAGETHDAPENDTAYYAAWEKAEATVTFDADGGEMEGGDITAKIGGTVTLPACTKEGYEFAGWYDDDTCAGNAGEEYTVARDVTLKAHYIKKEAPACTVTFDTDGGKEISPIKVEKGKAIRLPEAEKENHIFLGWYTEKEKGEKAGSELTVTEDITLYARWEKEAEKPEERPEATITFDADGGEMEGGDITAKTGDTITLPACTKEGYEFAGWYDNDTCAGNAGDEYTVTGDVTLKAHYEKKAETAYLITFDPNGGIKAEPIRAAKGEKITLPGTEKNGYIFLGWYTEKTGGILLGIAGDGLEVTKDMTVYALWEKENAGESGGKEPETCKAVFHTQGGALKNKTLAVIKGAGLYLPLPEKKGYDFAGWYLDQSLTQFAGAYRDAYRITKDTDFYAKWEKAKEDTSGGNDSEKDDPGQESNAETYTVKYDANGGTVKESSAKVEKGRTVKLPSAEREGYTFKGWHTAGQTFIGRAGSSYQPEQDITLFAKWEKTASGGSNGSAGDKNSPDTKTGTSVSDDRQDQGTDTSAGSAGAGVQKEPVIQTGRTTPIYLFAALGFFGILLAVFSIRAGKHSTEK